MEVWHIFASLSIIIRNSGACGSKALRCPPQFIVHHYDIYFQRHLPETEIQGSNEEYIFCIHCKDQVNSPLSIYICQISGKLSPKLDWLSKSQAEQGEVSFRNAIPIMDDGIQDKVKTAGGCGVSLPTDSDTNIRDLMNRLTPLPCDLNSTSNYSLPENDLTAKCWTEDSPIRSFTLLQPWDKGNILNPKICFECHEPSNTSYLMCRGIQNKSMVEGFPSLFHKCLSNCPGQPQEDRPVCSFSINPEALTEPRYHYCHNLKTHLYLGALAGITVVLGILLSLAFCYRSNLIAFSHDCWALIKKKSEVGTKITTSQRHRQPSETIFEDHELSSIEREGEVYYVMEADYESSTSHDHHDYYT